METPQLQELALNPESPPPMPRKSSRRRSSQLSAAAMAELALKEPMPDRLRASSLSAGPSATTAQDGTAAETVAIAAGVKPTPVAALSQTRAEDAETTLPVLPARRLSSTAYRIKLITFLGERTPILCQSVNGPCPILSIANFLSLTGSLHLPRSKTIEADALTQLLAEHLLQNDTGDLNMIAKLSALHKGLDVDPQFSSPEAFTSGQEVMQAFGAGLVHAWLPDPVHEAAAHTLLTQGPGRQGYEAAQTFLVDNLDKQSPQAQDALILKTWLNAHPNHMTPFGLQALQSSMQSGELRILFYNAHFSLLLKHFESEDLFCLVSDAGYAHAGDDVVWESLKLDEASVMLSSDFVPRDILALARQEDAFGRQASPSDTASSIDGDAAMARALQEEDDLRHAQELQDEESASERRREQGRRRAHAQEQAREGSRIQTQSAPAQPVQSVQGQPAACAHPIHQAGADSVNTGTKKSRKRDKDCIIM